MTSRVNYLTRPRGPCQVKEYKMISEQSLLTGYRDCQPHSHVCLIMDSTSVWSYRAGVNLGDVANYQI